MKCYFTIDPKNGNKVLIPGCYGSLHRDNLSCCTCRDSALTYNQFEKAQYNIKVGELNKDIEELRSIVKQLRKDNYQLIRIIEKVKNKICLK